MDSSCKKVSIIMPVYNSEDYLSAAIESILVQQFDSFELILINDGSKDRSGEICDQFASRDDRVRVIHKTNGGICSARNAGLRIATGEYIGFCDNDDRYLPGLIADNYELAKKYDADIVRFNRRRIIQSTNGSRQMEVNFMPQGISVFEGDEIAEHYPAIRKCSVAVWSALYKHELLKRCRIRFNEGVKSGLEDRIYNIILYRYANKIVLNSKVYYCWNRRETHSTTDRFNASIIRSIYWSAKVERETYGKLKIEQYHPKYWNDIVLFYLYFCFWNLDRRCCRLSMIEKIRILAELRNDDNLGKTLKEDASIGIADTHSLAVSIMQAFYQRKYLSLYIMLKFRKQEY